MKEKRAHREGRDKSSREEVRAEKRDKKEEKHDRIKLKRSYSAERDDKDYHREWEDVRASSVASNGSSYRSHNLPSPEESPRYADERGD